MIDITDRKQLKWPIGKLHALMWQVNIATLIKPLYKSTLVQPNLIIERVSGDVKPRYVDDVSRFFKNGGFCLQTSGSNCYLVRVLVVFFEGLRTTTYTKKMSLRTTNNFST